MNWTKKLFTEKWSLKLTDQISMGCAMIMAFFTIGKLSNGVISTSNFLEATAFFVVWLLIGIAFRFIFELIATLIIVIFVFISDKIKERKQKKTIVNTKELVEQQEELI